MVNILGYYSQVEILNMTLIVEVVVRLKQQYHPNQRSKRQVSVD